MQDGSLCPPPHASAWPVCNGKRRVSSAILVICHLEVWGRGPRTTRSARVSSHAYGALVVREGRFRRTRTAEMIADGRCAIGCKRCNLGCKVFIFLLTAYLPGLCKRWSWFCWLLRASGQGWRISHRRGLPMACDLQPKNQKTSSVTVRRRTAVKHV